jgi:hypothetical protein
MRINPGLALQLVPDKRIHRPGREFSHPTQDFNPDPLDVASAFLTLGRTLWVEHLQWE